MTQKMTFLKWRHKSYSACKSSLIWVEGGAGEESKEQETSFTPNPVVFLYQSAAVWCRPQAVIRQLIKCSIISLTSGGFCVKDAASCSQLLLGPLLREPLQDALAHKLMAVCFPSPNKEIAPSEHIIVPR